MTDITSDKLAELKLAINLPNKKQDEAVIDEAVEFIGDHEINPDQGIPVYKSGNLRHTIDEGLDREEMIRKLDKFKDDEFFNQIPLPLDYIANYAPHLWDKKTTGMTIEQYVSWEALNLKLLHAKDTAERRKIIKAELKKKLMKQYEKKLLDIPSMKKRNKEAKRLYRLEMEKLQTQKV
jgi:hypothetical protein